MSIYVNSRSDRKYFKRQIRKFGKKLNRLSRDKIMATRRGVEDESLNKRHFFTQLELVFLSVNANEKV